MGGLVVALSFSFLYAETGRYFREGEQANVNVGRINNGTHGFEIAEVSCSRGRFDGSTSHSINSSTKDRSQPGM